MILVDANLLLYAANHDAPEHQTARAWLDAKLSSTARVGLPWPSLLAFVRLATNPLVIRDAVPLPAAWAQVGNGRAPTARGCPGRPTATALSWSSSSRSAG